MRNRTIILRFVGVLLPFLSVHSLFAAGDAELAKAIRESDRCPGGLQIIVGPGNVDLAIALARTGKFDTQILLCELGDLQKARDTIVKQFQGQTFPYSFRARIRSIAD